MQQDENETTQHDRRTEKLQRGWHEKAEKLIHQTLSMNGRRGSLGVTEKQMESMNNNSSTLAGFAIGNVTVVKKTPRKIVQVNMSEFASSPRNMGAKHETHPTSETRDNTPLFDKKSHHDESTGSSNQLREDEPRNINRGSTLIATSKPHGSFTMTYKSPEKQVKAQRSPSRNQVKAIPATVPRVVRKVTIAL